MRSALFCVLGGPWGGILAGWLGGLAGRLGWASHRGAGRGPRLEKNARFWDFPAIP